MVGGDFSNENFDITSLFSRETLLYHKAMFTNPELLTEEVTSSISAGSKDVLNDSLFPGTDDVFYELEINRDYLSQKPYPPQFSSEKELLNIGDEVEIMLNNANSFNEMFEILNKVDGEAFKFKWKGQEIKGSEYWQYDDFPRTCDDYCLCMQKIFFPVLRRIEDSLINANKEEKDRAVEKLTHHILDNYKQDDWYFDRAAEICTSMLKINGLRALPQLKEVTEYITADNIKNLGYPEEDLYNPLFLRFDESEHWKFTAPVTRVITIYPWKEGEEKEVSKFLTEYLSINSEGNLDQFVGAFQKFGIESAFPYLLNNLKSDDLLTKRMSAEILFNLELGKIGVSEDGAKYLGKIYDLGKYNDPDFFVRRLNNSGLMAVLAQEGSIEGVFPLDLNSKEDLIHAEVRQLISQELFLPKADETQKERQEREEYLKLFLQNYESIFNDNFFQNTGVRLNSLDLHEQGWFLLHYLELSKNDNQESLEKLKNFVKEYGEYGLKSFLVLEYGGSGEDIIAFSEDESISKEQKLSFFKNFYSIANEAMNWKKIFEKVENGLEYKFSTEAYESLIRKNAEFFKAAQIISKSSDNEKLMIELFSNMNSVARSLRSLESFYSNGSGLKIVAKPTIHDEYGDNGDLIKGARHSWVFDSITGDRVAVSVRPKNTIEKNGIKGGSPRINFKVTNPKTKVSTRIGFDLSYYNVLMGESDTPSVSLDLGVLDPRFEAVNYATESVGRVLSLVQDSEGGHNENSFNSEASKHFENIANSFVEYINRTFSS